MRPVDIDEVCAAMEENSYEEYNYIDLETGEVVTVFEYNDFPENEELREAIEKEPERYIGIPSIPSHEFYRYMEEFIGTVSNETMRRKLGIAIQQRRPFRRFKDTVAQDPEEEIRWYEFRNNEIKREAIEWLEAEGIEWEEVYKMPTAEEKISEKEERQTLIKRLNQIYPRLGRELEEEQIDRYDTTVNRLKASIDPEFAKRLEKRIREL